MVAAVLTALLTTRRSKTETRWKAKYDAYSRILSSIEDIRYWAEETYASNLLLPSIGGDQLDAATKRFHEAKRVLWSYVHVGALVVSEDVREKLDDFLVAIGSEEHRFEEDVRDDDDYSTDLADHCDKIRNLVTERLPGLLASARSDIR